MNVTECLALADRISKTKLSRGGYDRKYRKVRGICEFSTISVRNTQRSSISDSPTIGNVDEEQSDKGEYP